MCLCYTHAHIYVCQCMKNWGEGVYLGGRGIRISFPEPSHYSSRRVLTQLTAITPPSLHPQYVQLSFLGIFTFTAPYLPWVLLLFSLLLGNSPVVDLMGMAAGK